MGTTSGYKNNKDDSVNRNSKHIQSNDIGAGNSKTQNDEDSKFDKFD